MKSLAFPTISDAIHSSFSQDFRSVDQTTTLKLFALGWCTLLLKSITTFRCDLRCPLSQEECCPEDSAAGCEKHEA